MREPGREIEVRIQAGNMSWAKETVKVSTLCGRRNIEYATMREPSRV